MNEKKVEKIVNLVCDVEALQLTEEIVYNWNVAMNRVLQIEKEREEDLSYDGDVEMMSVFCRMEQVNACFFSLLDHPQAVLLHSIVEQLNPLVEDRRMDREVAQMSMPQGDCSEIILPYTIWDQLNSREPKDEPQGAELHTDAESPTMVTDMFVKNILPHLSPDQQMEMMKELIKDEEQSEESEQQIKEARTKLHQLGMNIRFMASSCRQLMGLGLASTPLWLSIVSRELDMMQMEAAKAGCENVVEGEESSVTPVENELPGILQDLSDHAPEEFREATLMAAMPMLGTLATGIRAKYRDGKLNSPSFIVDIEAPQATGKSFVDKEFELLMDPVIKQDEVEWQKEMEYSLAKKNGEDVVNPCSQIRIIEPNIGVSAFLERALYAKGKHLFTYAPEIETVLKNNKGGAWTEKNDLFRLAYDNKPWGQHRISKDSFSGKVTLYYNMVMCGTPNKCRAFFADAESGLVSRVTPVVLPDMVGAKMPHFKEWTKEEEEKVKRQCLCMMDEEGEVDLPLINKAIEEWDEEKRQEYLQTLRYSLDVLRRRAALNGFRAGIIAYLLEGRQETERAIRFATWYAERCLHYQLQIYGDKIDALHHGMSPQTSRGNIRYLDALPKEFTKEDLVSLRLANNESPVVKTIIYRWAKEGQIDKIGTNLWKKVG